MPTSTAPHSTELETAATLDRLAVGDLVAINDENETAATILEFEGGTDDGWCTGAIVQLSSGDRVGAGFVQMSHARRFVPGQRRPWQRVTDPRVLEETGDAV